MFFYYWLLMFKYEVLFVKINKLLIKLKYIGYVKFRVILNLKYFIVLLFD